MTLSIDNTTISTANVVSNDTANSIAIDFSPIFLRIAIALEKIANNSSNVVNVLSTVANATYLAANNTANLANVTINYSNNYNSIANATYLSANNTANLVTSFNNISNTNFVQSNNLLATLNQVSNSSFAQSNNLIVTLNQVSNSSFAQSNNLVASVYSVANTANSNNIDLLSILDLLVSNTEILSNNSSEFVDLAAGRTNSGVKILSPWEWLSMSSIVKLYAEQGLDLNVLKNSVDALPKSK